MSSLPESIPTWQLHEAKNRLSALLDAVEHGQSQAITRHGTPVGVVVPYAEWRRAHARDADAAPSLYATLRLAASLGGLPDPPVREAPEASRLPTFT